MAMTISGDGSIAGLVAGGLPDATIVTADIADLNVTPAKLSQKLTSGTAVASTSGTSFTFSSIPSWVKRITILFQGVSTSGTSVVQVQIGTGSATTSGYVCDMATIANGATGAETIASGFGLRGSSASAVRSGVMTITNISGNIWVCSANVGDTGGNNVFVTGGYLSLGSTLDRVRITTVNGTDTFDAGSINIMYE